MRARGSSERSLSVQRAIAVLNVIGRSAEPVSASQIIEASGLGKTSVLRILATLNDEKIIERFPQSGRYRLGANLIALAHRALGQHPLIQRAAPVVEEIVEYTSDIALLMTLQGRKSLCIERRVGSSPIATSGTVIGTRSPLHAGGGPFALLAFSDDKFVDEYLSLPLEKLTEQTVVDPDAVRARIEEARERGFTIGNQDLFDYVVAFGIPIRGYAGELLGSLSIGGINHRYPKERCLEVGEELKRLVCRYLV